MLPPDAVCALAALFILGMVWLRTRMHYARERTRERARSLLGDGGRPAPLALTRAGWSYFAAVVVVLAAGWFTAPLVARQVNAAVPIAPTLARVIWFLAAYYLFIPVHRALRARGVEVFKSRVGPIQGVE